MKKLLLTLLLTCSTLSIGATAKTLNLGTSSSFEPYEFINSNNELDGFDIDLAKALCKQMQVECAFHDQGFDNLIPSLQARRLDAVVAGLDITPVREKQVLFTDIYYKNYSEFISVNPNIVSIADLTNKKVGVQNGTTQQKFLMEQHPTITIVNYDYYVNAMLDLKSNRIDAILVDSAVSDAFKEKDASVKIVGEAVTDPDYFGGGMAIAVRKNNKKLQQQFNQALAEIKANGTYDTIYKKWFHKSE